MSEPQQPRDVTIESHPDLQKQLDEITTLLDGLGTPISQTRLLGELLGEKKKALNKRVAKQRKGERERRGQEAVITVFGKSTLEEYARQYLDRTGSVYSETDVLERTAEIIELFGYMQRIAYNETAPNLEDVPDKYKLFISDYEIKRKRFEVSARELDTNSEFLAAAIPTVDINGTIGWDLSKFQNRIKDEFIQNEFSDYQPPVENRTGIICFPTPELIEFKNNQDCIEAEEAII